MYTFTSFLQGISVTAFLLLRFYSFKTLHFYDLPVLSSTLYVAVKEIIFKTSVDFQVIAGVIWLQLEGDSIVYIWLFLFTLLY